MEAELTVEDRDMLSVERLNLALNKDRDFFGAVAVSVDRMEPSVGTYATGEGTLEDDGWLFWARVIVESVDGRGACAPGERGICPSLASLAFTAFRRDPLLASSWPASSSAEKDSARRKRPVKPPDFTISGVGAGTLGALADGLTADEATSLYEGLEPPGCDPCDSGEGFAG